MDNQLTDVSQYEMTLTRSEWNPKALDAPATPGTQNAVAAALDWRRWRACKGLEPDEAMRIFYPEDGTAPRATMYDEARTFCSRCPVTKQCLEEAIETRDVRDGFRANLRPDERRRARGRAVGRMVQDCLSCGESFGSVNPAMFCTNECRVRYRSAA